LRNFIARGVLLIADNCNNIEDAMNRKASTLMSLGVSAALIAAGIWVLCNYIELLRNGGPAESNYLMMGGSRLEIIMILFWLAILSAIGLVAAGLISKRRSSGRNSSQAIK
jgi:divalent metal cation (Fe/Co/Zn/Cd) transporter